MFSDLRSWPRNLTDATVSIIKNSELVGICRIENLSAGGVLLSAGADLVINSDCRLILNLPGLPPIEVEGRIVRTQSKDEGGKSYAVAFHGVDPDTEDLVHNFLLSQLEHQHNEIPFVLIVDDSADFRRALERELRAMGLCAVLAAMPLDAVRLLCSQDINIDIAIVDLVLGPADGMHLLKYLKREHPKIQRILTCDQQRACQLELAVTFGHAHAALPKPWSREQLSDVIGRLNAAGQAA